MTLRHIVSWKLSGQTREQRDARGECQRGCADVESVVDPVPATGSHHSGRDAEPKRAVGGVACRRGDQQRGHIHDAETTRAA